LLEEIEALDESGIGCVVAGRKEFVWVGALIAVLPFVSQEFHLQVVPRLE
jgi:hypothetical protein